MKRIASPESVHIHLKVNGFTSRDARSHFVLISLNSKRGQLLKEIICPIRENYLLRE